MKKAFPYLLLAVLAIAALLIKRNAVQARRVTETVDRNNGLDRRTNMLEYTAHATCKMNCVHISQQQVAQILQNGQINDAEN